MDLINFEVPDRTHFNAIQMDALDLYIREHFGIENEEFLEYIFDVISEWISGSIAKERGKWLGAVLRALEETEHEYNHNIRA